MSAGARIEPTFPAAPYRATFTVRQSSRASIRRPSCRSRESSWIDALHRSPEVILVGADPGGRQALRREKLGGKRGDIGLRDGVDSGDRLVDRCDLAPGDDRL